ncbi:MAG: hypothetical protein EOP83_10880 [Verrucomicrobiaceae bacterium]|nr:MAG: hypothetical protein EOP83_10880 [Verrucomicrobiaceae bacterium]
MLIKEYEVFACNAQVSDYTRIGYIGTPMILQSRDYDPDQMWLPFMQGVVLRYAPSEYYRGEGRSKAKIPAHMRREYATVPDACKAMYDYTCPEQFLLPFREFQYVRGNELDMARRGWARSAPDRIIRHSRGVGAKPQVIASYFSMSLMDIKNLKQDELAIWAQDHLLGRFGFDCNQIQFEYEVDWLFTKLRFKSSN